MSSADRKACMAMQMALKRKMSAGLMTIVQATMHLK